MSVQIKQKNNSEFCKNHKKLHEENKKKVLNVLKKASEYCEKYSLSANKKAFDCLFENVQNGYFTITVVGEFSSGKSTFLNALMGKRYLPALSSETTATVNFLRDRGHKEEDYICVKYCDGRLEEKIIETPSDIERYVTRKSDLKVASEIEAVDLFLESRFLRDGVVLVDSPGLNGMAEGHREITEQQIKKSHACIFVFDSAQPGRKTDFDFLKYLKVKVNTIIFVLNKIDLIRPEEQSVEEVCGVLEANYKNYFPEEEQIPPILPIAAYPALVAKSDDNLEYHSKSSHTKEEKQMLLENSRMKVFEERLWFFLTQGEKTRQELSSPLERVNNLLMERKEELKQNMKKMEEKSSADDIREEIIRIEKEMENLEESLKDKGYSVREDLRKIRNEFCEEIKAKAEDIKAKYIKDVSEWTDFDEYDTPEKRENFEKKIKMSFERFLGRIPNTLKEKIENIMRDEIIDFLPETSKIINVKDLEFNFNYASIYGSENLAQSFDQKEKKEELNRCEKELSEAEDKSYELAKKAIAAANTTAQRELLQNKLNSQEKLKQEIERFLGEPPAPDIRTRNVVKAQWRGGLLGGIATILIGKKMVEKQETFEDYTKVNNYEQRKSKKEEQIEQNIKNLKKELDEIPSQTAEIYKLEATRFEKEAQDKKQQLQYYREEYLKEFQKRNENELKNIKRNIEDFLNMLAEEFVAHSQNVLEKCRSSFSEEILNFIGSDIKLRINQRKEEKELFLSKLESSVEERNKTISLWKQEIEEIDSILVLGNEVSVQMISKHKV
jgi:GTPase SAR1 family protein